MRHKHDLSFVVLRFLGEIAPYRVILVLVHGTEDQVQTVDVAEAIIEVAEHHPIGIGCIKTGIPCPGYPTFRNAHLTYAERVAIKAFLRQFVLLPVIDEKSDSLEPATSTL